MIRARGQGPWSEQREPGTSPVFSWPVAIEYSNENNI